MPHNYWSSHIFPRNIHNSYDQGKPDDYYLNNVLIYFIRTKALIRARELEGNWWWYNDLENITRFTNNDFFKTINPRFANFPPGTWKVYCNSKDVADWQALGGPENLFLYPGQRMQYGHDTFFHLSNGDCPLDGEPAHPGVRAAWHIDNRWHHDDDPIIYHNS